MELKIKNNLDSLYIYGFSENILLSGDYSDKEITEIMINNWISYFECHKCGKWDYCKHAKKHPGNPDLSIEIQCGIAIDFIKNYISTTFSLISTLTPLQKQAYLNNAYHLTCFIQNSEQTVGSLINRDYLRYWGDHAPSLYGMTKETINILNKSHKEMKNIPFFNSKRSVLFVEGHSEKIFASNFLNIEVVNYGGAGNITYSKIEYTIKKYKDEGYNIYIQADKDGKSNNQNIDKIISKKLVKKENIFCFEYDFETSIPIYIFFNLLTENNIIQDTLDIFKKSYEGTSLSKYTESKYNIALDKRLLASKICEYIDNSSRKSNPFYDESFLKTEIGRFWYFLNTKIA